MIKPRDAAMRYIKARKILIACRQAQFKQLCQRCRYWDKCTVYPEYVQAWMDLQESVK